MAWWVILNSPDLCNFFCQNLPFASMVKHCAFGVCTSDSRKPQPGVTFVPFPKPFKNRQMVKRWIHLCGRKDFTIKDVNRNTYVCSKHFEPGVELDWKKNPSLEPVLLPTKPQSDREKRKLLREKVSSIEVRSQ